VSPELSAITSGAASVWALAGSLSGPIFQGGRIKQNYEAAVARYDQALAQFQRSALNAYREVADALITIQKLAERRKELEYGVEALRDATQLSRARYDTGLSSYLEVLIADQQLFAQELQLAQSGLAAARSRSSTGRWGGWQRSDRHSASQITVPRPRHQGVCGGQPHDMGRAMRRYGVAGVLLPLDPAQAQDRGKKKKPLAHGVAISRQRPEGERGRHRPRR
jgi:hypothetical protein